ncbi:MAG: hypothetical protein GEU73_08185 [Chloroflexi bacterium]|nr:hypothetical protein [Chloroflexota bacterium]
MEPRPRGANFTRAAFLWEVALHIAGRPDEPYGGNRDMAIVVGSGSGESFRPWLRMSTGSAILATAVVQGELEMAFVNPSGLLTQAYRGTGLFSEPLPVRVVASYPSWDRFVCVIDPRTNIRSFSEIQERRYPLRISIREDSTHSTRVLIDQMLEFVGYTLADLVSWGGTLQLVGGPGDTRRINAIAAHEVDAVFDEGIGTWLTRALDAGFVPLTLEEPIFAGLQALGWRKAILPVNRFPSLSAPHTCIDFSGWPLYTRASLPDEMAYDACAAIAARAEWIPLGQDFTSVADLGTDTEVTPLDVPLHPGAARWFREHTAHR